ncbi:MAG: sugar ABC transporter permease [Eubacteriales bacterium]|nr:sugar ABC transporter permease [Eubacteriales bacterium]
MKRKRGFLTHNKRNNLVGWFFVTPALIGFLGLNLVPMLLSGYYSLCEYSVLGEPKFIGIGNYVQLFSGADTTFWPSVKATVSYAILAVPCNLAFAFAIALLLNRPMKGRALFRSIFYLPCILPAVASSFVWLLLMNPDFGLLNEILSFCHLPESQWLWGESSVIPSIVFMGIWATGSTQVIFLAGLQNIPSVYYEALEIDGGNILHKFWYVTLPMISSTLFFNLVMGIINALQVFSQAYILTDGGPNNASLFYVYNLWRAAFKYMSMGTACAMSWILFVVVLLLTLFVFRSSKRWVYYEGEG